MASGGPERSWGLPRAKGTVFRGILPCTVAGSVGEGRSSTGPSTGSGRTDWGSARGARAFHPFAPASPHAPPSLRRTSVLYSIHDRPSTQDRRDPPPPGTARRPVRCMRNARSIPTQSLLIHRSPDAHPPSTKRTECDTFRGKSPPQGPIHGSRLDGCIHVPAKLVAARENHALGDTWPPACHSEAQRSCPSCHSERSEAELRNLRWLLGGEILRFLAALGMTESGSFRGESAWSLHTGFRPYGGWMKVAEGESHALVGAVDRRRV